MQKTSDLNVVETQSAKKAVKTTAKGGGAMDVEQVDWLNDDEYLYDEWKGFICAALRKAKGGGKGKAGGRPQL